jgi:hypothetical protein
VGTRVLASLVAGAAVEHLAATLDAA